MFGTIRRHQKWLWLVIITVTIISFVIYFTPYDTSYGGRREGGDFGSIHGRKVSQQDMINAHREALLRFRIYARQWPDNQAVNRQMGFNEERETQNRLLLIEKLREFEIQVSDQAVADWIASVFRDRNQPGFSLDYYQQFIKQELSPRGLRESDLHRFARHEVGIQHLISVAGLAGKLVTPREAEALYRQENQQVSATAIFFSASNHLATVNITPEAVAQFYTNRQAAYRIAERIQVAYARFDATNYMSEADQQLAEELNLNQAIESIYQQRGPNFFKNAQGTPMTPEAAKERIKQELRHEMGLRSARKQAVAFANELFEMAPQPENLERLAAAKGYESKLSQPFDSDGPAELNVLDTFTRAAFALTPEEPFSAPVVDSDAVFVLALKRKFPAEIPPLDAIRERVTEDYRRSQAIEAARQAGRGFYQKLTNEISQGKSAEAVAADLHEEWVKLPPYSRSSRSLPELENRASLTQLKDAAFELQPGQVSALIPNREGGFILQLQSLLPVDEAKLKAELPEFLERLRQNRQYEIFDQWFAKERERAGLKLTSGQ